MEEGKKECFWRHGNYKTIATHEYTYKGDYTVKRWMIIQQCGFCGKIIFVSSMNA